MPSLVSILELTISPNQKELGQALEYLQQAAKTNFSEFLMGLCTVLADPSLSEVVRMAAALQMKNYLTSKVPLIKHQYQLRWLAIKESCRATIRQLALQALGTETSRTSSVAQVIASIACAEIPLKQWQDLMPNLVQIVVSTKSSEMMKQSALETIGYICSDMQPGHLMSHSNDILTGIVHGLRKDEPSLHVKLAAANAMLNSLEFSKNNFKLETERDVIMQVLCESSQMENTKIKVASLQCLVKIMSLHYQHMEAYMGTALFSITVAAMQSSDDDVIMQGIEFWTNVCEEELELAEDLKEAAEVGSLPLQTSRFYAKGALQYVVPILAKTLTKQEEVPEDDDWNPAKAAGVCLTFFATLCEDDVIPQVVPFVLSNLANPDWRYRDAAVMAFGSILQGPDKKKLEEVLDRVLVVFIFMLQDVHVAVRDTAAWAIGRICEFVPLAVLKEDTLMPLLSAMIESLNSGPRVAAHICWAFASLAESAYHAADTLLNEPVSYAMSGVYEKIVERLLQITDRSDAHHNNLRTAAYEAVMEFIKNSPKDCYETVLKTTTVVMGRIHGLLMIESQIQTPSDRAHYNALQSLLCGTLQSVLKKVRKDHVASIADDVMAALFEMMKSSNGASIVQEDALMTVGILVQILGAEFVKYLEAMKTHLLAGLSDSDEYEIFAAAVGVVGDLCRGVGKQVLPYCDDIMNRFLSSLLDGSVQQGLKPQIISVFGDVALALGKDFKKYLGVTLQLLQQAATTRVEKTDYETIEYMNELRESCLEAYTGVVQGLKGDNKDDISDDVKLLSPHLPFILSFVEDVANDEEHADGAVAAASGLIGDLCEVFGKLCGPDLAAWIEAKPSIGAMLVEGRRSKTCKTSRLARWGTQAIQKLIRRCPRSA